MAVAGGDPANEAPGVRHVFPSVVVVGEGPVPSRGERSAPPVVDGHLSPSTGRTFGTSPSILRRARAYAQYVTTKSQEPVLLQQLEAEQETGDVIRNLAQWSDEQFAPVLAAIDDLFRRQGWLR